MPSPILLDSGCYSTWFTECSGHGICLNGSCVCEDNWTGNGIYFNEGTRDCSIYFPAIFYMTMIFTPLSAGLIIPNLIVLYNSWKKFDIRKSTHRISISIILFGFVNTINNICWAHKYYVHNNLGLWFMYLLFYFSILCILDSLVHMTVEITYKLKQAHKEMQQATLTMVIICGIISGSLLLGTNLTKDGEIQIVLSRATNAVWLILSMFYAGAFFYFGMKIEQMLQLHPDRNETVIQSLRRFRYLFTLFLFNCSLVALVSVIWPAVMNWFYPVEFITYDIIVTFINIRFFLKRRNTRKSTTKKGSSSSVSSVKRNESHGAEA